MGSASPGFGRDGGPGSKRKKHLGGQRKSLKRLNSAKRIQGNPSLFLCWSLAGLWWILLDLAKFGSGLEFAWRRRRPTPPAALPNAADCRQGPLRTREELAAHDPQRAPSVRFRPRRERRDDPRQRPHLRREGDRPARRGDRPRQPVSARPLAQDGGARPARDHRAGGIRRAGLGLPRTLRGDGGGDAREWLGRAVVRGSFKPLRQSDRAQRRLPPEGALSAE